MLLSPKASNPKPSKFSTKEANHLSKLADQFFDAQKYETAAGKYHELFEYYEESASNHAPQKACALWNQSSALISAATSIEKRFPSKAQNFLKQALIATEQAEELYTKESDQKECQLRIAYIKAKLEGRSVILPPSQVLRTSQVSAPTDGPVVSCSPGLAGNANAEMAAQEHVSTAAVPKDMHKTASPATQTLLNFAEIASRLSPTSDLSTLEHIEQDFAKFTEQHRTRLREAILQEEAERQKCIEKATSEMNQTFSARISEQEKEKEKLQQALDTEISTHATTKEEVNRFRESLTQIQSELSSLQNEKDEVKSSLLAQETRLQKVLHDNEELQAKIRELEAENKQLRLRGTEDALNHIRSLLFSQPSTAANSLLGSAKTTTPQISVGESLDTHLKL